MGSLWIRVIIVIAVCGLFDASLASCQTKPSIQLPEFYGTYAIAGGKTASLDSPKDLGPTSRIRMGVRQNLGPVCDSGYPVVAGTSEAPIPKLTEDVQFLVFFEPSGTFSPMLLAQEMKLTSVSFVRDILVHGCDPNAPDRGGVRRGRENAWDFETNALEMSVKPVPGQPQMAIAVPTSHLEAGVYRLSGGPLKASLMFFVAPADEAEKTKCIDLTVEYNVFILGSRIQSQTPTPCAERVDDGSSVGAAQSGASQPDVNSGESNVSAGGLTELVASWDKTLGQGQAASIPMCRSGSGFANRCEIGTLSLGPQEVSFVKSNGQKVFTALAPQIKYRSDPNLGGGGVFSLAASGQHARLLYLAQGVDCPDLQEGFPVCPAAGMEQQNIVSDWIKQALVRLASGSSNAVGQK